MIRCRNSGGYGGRLFGIVDSSPHRGTMSTEAGQLHNIHADSAGTEVATARTQPSRVTTMQGPRVVMGASSAASLCEKRPLRL
jgi:hypothetical protein